jgi:hypothetical protein
MQFSNKFLSLSIPRNWFSIILTIIFIIPPSKGAENDVADSKLYPIKIRLIPTDKKKLREAKEFPDDASGKKYTDQYGLGVFFDYMGSVAQDDIRLLDTLKNYKKRYLANSNPLLVRFNLHTTHGLVIFYAGLFVSGQEDYLLRKKENRGVKSVITAGDLLCSNFFKLKVDIDYDLIGLIDKSEFGEANPSYKQATKELKELLTPATREKLTKDTDSCLKPQLSSATHTLQSLQTALDLGKLEESLKNQIQKIEEAQLQKLAQFSSSSGMHTVPSIFPITVSVGSINTEETTDPAKKGVFPISLFTLDGLFGNLEKHTTFEERHFNNIVKRLLGFNLKNSGQRPSKTSSVQRLCHLLGTNPDISELCFRLFSRYPLDSEGKDGCFDASFPYYFSDSEQSFLEWLEAIYDNIELDIGTHLDDFPYSIFELDDKNKTSFLKLPVEESNRSPLLGVAKVSSSSSQTNSKDSSASSSLPSLTTVKAIEMDFLSYFDMCRACRGSLSYLLSNNWIQQRVVKCVKAWFQHNNKALAIDDSVPINLTCVSFARCDKGELS